MNKSKRLNIFSKKFFIMLAGLAILVYSLVLVWRYQEFSNSLTTLNGIRHSDSQSDIKYLLGLPTHVVGPTEEFEFGTGSKVFTVDTKPGDQNGMTPGTQVEDYEEWTWENGARFEVKFDTSGAIDSFTWYCQIGSSCSWGPIVGISNGDEEDKVLRLGKPTNTSITDFTKIVEFSDIGLEFMLVKGHVYMVTVRQENEGPGARIYRFLQTLP